jgi:alpha-L-rhamnosidase
MKKWIDHMAGYLEDNIMPRDRYGDWCVPPESPELIHSKDEKRTTAKALLGTSYYFKDLCLMEQYAMLLGKTDDAEVLKQQAEQIKIAFNKKFFDPDMAQYDNGSQTSFVLPLAFGLVPENRRRAVFANLARKIETETDFHIGTGLIGGQWLMRVLSDNGRPDLAFAISTQTTYPSWGYMIENGATTIWELWNGNTADPAMNSHNHVMLVGDLNIWMTEYLAGIRSDVKRPGFKHIILHPTPVGSLSWAKASYRSIHGTISSDWRISDSNFTWTFTVPANTMATAYIPARDASDVKEDGEPVATSEGVTFLGMEGDRAIFSVASGRYSWISAWTFNPE